ncbi:transmembrane emp24 domain-containing protein 3-like [Saccoglossus kowalevskii]|uniref:Transmembrane emp24 domain-containing protein 3-like n=1 Tax=Saccoglossus kowalevskii TaxID=10224 RepID=A0ABM0GTM3_SACKO|nr:PREDICTED: transmembrane emp24 domain-containing protein 3-like [Saccoglossus kowalevskii]
MLRNCSICLLVLLLAFAFSRAVELTFELPDNARQCFHEEIDEGVKVRLEFQVVTGGRYDVDAIVESPQGGILYKETKKQYDSFTWKTDRKGVYKFCFSNEFSTFAHKVVYFDFMVGDDDLLSNEVGKHATALTLMETSCVGVHEALKVVIDYQTHFRLREAQSRVRAEHMNERIQYWSVGQAVVILVTSLGQILILRSFFTEKRPSSSGKI